MTLNNNIHNSLNLHAKYHLQNVINASGRMTILGVSTPAPSVVESLNYGLNHFFVMKDLVNATGRYIAKLLDVENAVIVSSASAGIAQSVAALIIQDDPDLLINLHERIQTNSQNLIREVIIPKGHNVNYGGAVSTMIALGGGIIVEAGYANQCSADHIEAKITPNTAAIMYIKSHHCVQKSMLSIEQAVMVAQKNNIPLIIDAAAEEDLRCYYQMGADLVIYSGSKAIEGPTSGLVIGKSKYIEWVKQQSNGIGRAMKVGKENILGLTCAIEYYLSIKKITGQEMIDKMMPFIEQINHLKGLSAKAIWDTSGRDIARTEISVDQKITKKTAGELIELLKQGETAIFFREHRANEGKVEVDVRSVSTQQLDTIYTCISRLIE